MAPERTAQEPKPVPPVGLAPEGYDYAHPWIISAGVSALCFLVGFACLYPSGVWAQFGQWADGPFLFCFALLAPVLVGFTLYGIVIVIRRIIRGKK